VALTCSMLPLTLKYSSITSGTMKASATQPALAGKLMLRNSRTPGDSQP